jgi:hypothetical protein
LEIGDTAGWGNLRYFSRDFAQWVQRCSSVVKDFEFQSFAQVGVSI